MIGLSDMKKYFANSIRNETQQIRQNGEGIARETGFL